MNLFNPLSAPKEQFDPLAYFGGVSFWDNYYEHSPGDSELWLRMFVLAEKRHGKDLYPILMHVRNTGARLIKSTEYGYKIEPVIGPNGWGSVEEYNKERQALGKYRESVVGILKELIKAV